MDKLAESMKIIEQELKRAASPISLCSFQKDSLLLTYLVRVVNPDVPVLWFRDELNPFAEQVIKKWDLQVFGYAPVDRYLIPDQDGLMLVDEFAVGASRLPVLRVVAQGDRCDLERLPSKRTPFFSYPWDVTFFGFKAADAQEHFVTGNAVLPQGFNLGHARMVAPLYSLSDEEVLTAIAEQDIPYEQHDDSLSICEQCFDSLSYWDRTASLSAFQKRFGFDQVH